MKIITSEIIDKAEDLYKEGVSLADIGKQLNISPYGTLSKKLKERGVKIIARNPAIKYTVDEEYFHNINCEEKAYWLGFLMADGYVYQQRKKTDGKLKSRLELGLSSVDEGHIKKFLSSVKSNNPIKYRVLRKLDRKYVGSSIPTGENEKDYTTTAVTEIYNKTFVNGLIKQNCIQNKSHILKWPKNVSQKLECHFIRGYFDGDGSIYKTKKGSWEIVFASASKEFIRVLQDKLNTQKIRCSISKGKGCEILRIKKDSHNAIKYLLYKTHTMFLDRKKEKFDAL